MDSHSKRITLAACIAAFSIASALSAQGDRAQLDAKTDKAVIRAARKELAAAGKLTRVPRGTSISQRAELLERATRAYFEVEQRYSRVPAIVAEAAFRQGQVLGRVGKSAEAIRAFQRAAERDADAFGARALLEAGHVQRRDKMYTDAAAMYRRAVERRGGRYSDRARLWLGKTLARLGRVPDARREWRSLGTDAKADGYVRIQAFDELAMSFVREKSYAEAERVIREAADALAAETSGESKKAKALRGSLGRMRCKKSLTKAKARAKAKGQRGSDR